MGSRVTYDVRLLRELWAKNEETRIIAQRLGVSSSTVQKEAQRLGLCKRPRRRVAYRFDGEPTAEQVAEYEQRRAEVWAKHLSDKRSGTLSRGTNV